MPPETTGVLANAGAVVADASGRARVSQLATLFDGKILNAENTNLWSSAGTGTATFNTNTIVLAVTTGQYRVRQGKFRLTYFSGKPQVIELTFDNFAPEPGLIKRVGYFSSSSVAPYTANFDGWYLESNGGTGTVYLVVVNNGTEKLRLAQAEWDNPLIDYNWNTFTVLLVDFLWLGGAVLRLFIKNPTGGFAACHTFNYAGSSAGTFMLSPNHPVRYELRSTTGTGSFRAICSQVSTEGSTGENGEALCVYNQSAVPSNTIGTRHALKGVRKRAAYRDTPVRVTSFGLGLSSSDTGILSLMLNPVLSAPLVYTVNGVLDEGTATTQTVVSGRVLISIPVGAAGISSAVENNSLSWLGETVDGVFDELVLVYMPLTTNQSVVGILNLLTY